MEELNHITYDENWQSVSEPETGKVIQKLRDRGIDIDREIITKDALIKELKKLLGGKND